MRSAFVVPLLALCACTKRDVTPTKTEDAPTPTPIASSAAAADASRPPEPLRFERIELPNDRKALVLRGPHEHRLAMVYLHGMCVYPGYYVDSFIETAAKRGDVVAIQGDQSCGGEWVASWSLDIAALDRRIDAALSAAAIPSPKEIVLIGYSQGADRSEALVARFPDKYKAVILIASSSPPSPARLRTVRAAALMAGTRDSSANMLAGQVALSRAGIKTTFIPMPGAWHGHMGDDPELTMGKALDFVE